MPSLPPQHLTGFLRGFIDVVLAVERRYYVVDYKSNRPVSIGRPRRGGASGGHGAITTLFSTLSTPSPCDGYCAGALAREGKRPWRRSLSLCGAWTPIPSWAFLLTILTRTGTR